VGKSGAGGGREHTPRGDVDAASPPRYGRASRVKGLGSRVRRRRCRRPLPSELHVTVSRHAAQAFTNAPRGTRPLWQAAFTIRAWSRATVRQTFFPSRECQPGVRLGAAPASISAADISACLPESVTRSGDSGRASPGSRFWSGAGERPAATRRPRGSRESCRRTWPSRWPMPATRFWPGHHPRFRWRRR
jgi:hypothetical protein